VSKSHATDTLCQKAEQSQVYSESFATKLGRYTRRSFKRERGSDCPIRQLQNLRGALCYFGIKISPTIIFRKWSIQAEDERAVS
jgi:hypothetical protein